MNVKLISSTHGKGEFEGKSVEDIIAYSARVSSSRELNEKFKDVSKLLNYCIKHKHWSVFETGTITFEITTSKAIGIQLLRHRSFTFQEFSQRYATVTQMEDVEIRRQHNNNRQSSTEVFNPDIFNGNGSAKRAIQEHLNYSQHLYNALLKANVARECARMVLPMAASTTIYMTGSVRSWIHFLDARDDEHAQKEIREIAKAIKNILIKELPLISNSLNWKINE